MQVHRSKRLQAPGSSFGLMLKYRPSKGCNIIDIIEAYGGEWSRHPNAFDTYMITPHC